MDFNGLLKHMVKEGASDLFISAGVAPSMKISGYLTPVGKHNPEP